MRSGWMVLTSSMARSLVSVPSHCAGSPIAYGALSSSRLAPVDGCPLISRLRSRSLVLSLCSARAVSFGAAPRTLARAFSAVPSLGRARSWITGLTNSSARSLAHFLAGTHTVSGSLCNSGTTHCGGLAHRLRPSRLLRLATHGSHVDYGADVQFGSLSFNGPLHRIGLADSVRHAPGRWLALCLWCFLSMLGSIVFIGARRKARLARGQRCCTCRMARSHWAVLLS